MQAYQENISAKVNGVLSPILGVKVTVTDDATGRPATLFSDNGVTQITGDIVTDETGYFGFRAANGSYTISFSSPQIRLSDRNIDLYDPRDDAPLTQSQAASPSGASRIGAGSQTVEQALNGKVDKATGENRKVVFFGSSVCFGQGATNYQGWAYKLTQRLTAKGYTTVNHAIPGNSTLDLLNRFYTDVAPENPDVVVIGLSLANEGILNAGTAAKEAAYQQYLDNMFTLVGRCRKLGYRVIVTAAYPNLNYTDVEYSYVKQVNEELDSSDIPYVNFLGAVDDGAGHWRTGMWTDALHPNDIGHEALSRTFAASLFDRLPYAVAPSKFNPSGKRGVAFDATDATAGRIMCTPDDPVGSFTLMTFVRRPAGAGAARAILVASAVAGDTDPLRVNNPTDAWSVQGEGQTAAPSTKLSSDGALDHLALTFDYYTGTAKLYVNGALASTINVGAKTFIYFSIGSRLDSGGANALSYQFRDLALYRTALNAAQIQQAANGWYSKASLDVFSPVFESEIKGGYRLANLAPTRSFFMVNGSALISKDVS